MITVILMALLLSCMIQIAIQIGRVLPESMPFIWRFLYSAPIFFGSLGFVLLVVASTD